MSFVTAPHTSALRESLGALDSESLLKVTVERASRGASPAVASLQQAVLGEVPEFSRSRNPDLLPELAHHAREHVDELLRLLRGGAPGNFGFVEQHARRRAEQRFPLAATLHAYRRGHKVLARWLRDAVLAAAASGVDAQRTLVAVADLAMEYTDVVSTTFAAAYSSHSLLLAELAGDQRTELLGILLEGQDEADPHAARRLREAGFLDERQSFGVALARAVDATEMLNAARARRLADAVDQIVAEVAARRLVDVHDNKVIVIFAAVRRDSGWTAPRSSLARRIQAALARVGNAALIGVSNDMPSTSHIPMAYREAAAALELASVTERVVQFSDLSLQRLLLHFAAKDFHRVLPAWTQPFHDVDARAGGALVATLRAYAAADMNVLQAAQALSVHANTIYARLQRIHEISGLQPRSFDALRDLLTVCDCRQDTAHEISRV